MSGFKRAERVSGEVHRALSEEIRGVKDPRVGPLSITSVQVTADLRIARIRIVPLGGIGDAQSLLEGLRAASGYLSRRVAKNIRMKYSPKLEFFIDDSLEQAFQIVDQLTQEDEEEE